MIQEDENNEKKNHNSYCNKCYRRNNDGYTSICRKYRKCSTDLSLYIANDPVYTVTVPETVSLDAKEHTQVPITASDVQYIPEGKKISVTFQKGNGTYGRLYMVGDKMNGSKPYMMTLNIKGTSGDFKSGALEKQIKGMELGCLHRRWHSKLECIRAHRLSTV